MNEDRKQARELRRKMNATKKRHPRTRDRIGKVNARIRDERKGVV